MLRHGRDWCFPVLDALIREIEDHAADQRDLSGGSGDAAQIHSRAVIVQQKTGRLVQFKILDSPPAVLFWPG